MSTPPVRWLGPPDASTLVVLAPGDMGCHTDPAPTALADGFADAGLRVCSFSFPPCDTPDGAVRDALLAQHIRAHSARKPGTRLILAGLSRGARVSVSLVEELGADCLIALAYPFHARSDPDPGDRVQQLAAVPVPTLLFQGTRDSHGNQQQVRGYTLPAHIHVHWLEDANHALRPRARSGHTQAEQLHEVLRAATSFLNDL
jgi:predicted alpha/beta-hydrolase family hydrolase